MLLFPIKQGGAALATVTASSRFLPYGLVRRLKFEASPFLVYLDRLSSKIRGVEKMRPPVPKEDERELEIRPISFNR